MEVSDVVKARTLLRKMIHRIENAYSRDIENQIPLGPKEEPYHIVIEFDNSLAVNESTDCIFWNDEEGFCLIVTNGKNSAHAENFMLGRNGEIRNPFFVLLIVYAEIQQFRMVLDVEGYDQLMDAVIENGNFVSIRGKDEVPVDNQMKEHVRKLIKFSVDPINNISATNYSHFHITT